MYIPSHFNESRIDVLQALIAQYPMGLLVTNGQSGLDVNHLPFHLDASAGELGVLHAHVARNNPVWQDIASGDNVLVVFQAGDAYISPNWYPSKQEFHKQVPTWNYTVVHAQGRVTIRDDERYVRGVVGRLTRTHEASQPRPWKMSDSPREFIDAMLKAVVGIEIEITALAGKAKLSQNKEGRDIQGAADALNVLGEHAIAEAMLTNLPAKGA